MLTHELAKKKRDAFTHLDELVIALSPLVGNAGEMGVPLLAVPSHYPAVVELVLTQESLRVVVAVDVDLRKGVVRGRLLHPLVYA